MKTFTLKASMFVTTCLALLFCGCTHQGRPPVGAIPTDRQMADYLKNTKDANTFWVSVGPSSTGHGYTFRNANRVHNGKVTAVEFASPGESSRPLIMVSSRTGAKFPSLLDTTTRNSWVDFQASQDMRIAPLSKTPANKEPLRIRPRHVEDNMVSFCGISDMLRFGKLRVENPVLNIRPQYLTLGTLSRSNEQPEPQIVIGNELQRNFSFVQYDFPDRQVIFSTTERYEPEPNSVIAELTLYRHKGALACKGQINDYEGYILLDVAGNYPVALDTGESAADIRIGDLKIDNAAVVSADSKRMLLGEFPRVARAVLKNYRLTFDFEQAKIIIQKPYTEDIIPTERSIFRMRDEFKLRRPDVEPEAEATIQ